MLVLGSVSKLVKTGEVFLYHQGNILGVHFESLFSRDLYECMIETTNN